MSDEITKYAHYFSDVSISRQKTQTTCSNAPKYRKPHLGELHLLFTSDCTTIFNASTPMAQKSGYRGLANSYRGLKTSYGSWQLVTEV